MFGSGGSVGELQVRVTADTSAMATKIAATANAAGRTSAVNFGKSFSGGLNASGLWQDAAGKWRNGLGQFATAAEQQAAGVGQRVGATMAQNVNSGASKFWKTAGIAAVGTAVAGGAALAAITTVGVKTAAANEQAAMSFEVLLGSADKAQDYLRELADFAARTPFDLPTLRDAASRLVAVGMESERVIPLMTKLGDATSAMGTGAVGIDRAVYALTQMQNAGKVTALDMKQLTDAGIPAWDALAASIGKSIAETKELVSTGTVESEAMFKALESGAGESMARMSGMMEKQSKTLVGQFSTLKDTVEQTLGQAAQPFAAQLAAVMPQITNMTQGLATALAPSFEALGGLVEGLTPIIGSLGGVFATLANNVLQILADTVVQLQPAFAALAPVASQFFNMLGGALGEVLPQVAKLLSELLVALMPLSSAFMTMLQPMLTILPSLFTTLVTAATPIIEVFAQVAMILGGAFKRHMNEIVPLLGQLAAAFGESFIEMAPAFKDIAVAMVPVAQELAKMMPDFTKLLVELIPLAIPLIKMFSQALALLAQYGLTNAVQQIMVLMRVGRSLIQAFIGIVAGFRAMPGQFAAIWSSISNAFATGVNTAIAWVTGLPGRAVAALGNIGSTLFNAGAQLIQGFISGITSKIGEVTSTLTGITNRLPDWKGPATRDATLLTRNGQLVIDGFVKGLRSREGDVKGYLNTLTGEVSSMRVPGSGAWRAPGAAVAGATGAVTYEVVVNNPVPEKASASLPAALRRASFVAGYGL